jgi:hypothetical protein
MHYHIQLKLTSICNLDVHVSETHKHFIVHINMACNPLALIYNNLFLHINNYI